MKGFGQLVACPRSTLFLIFTNISSFRFISNCAIRLICHLPTRLLNCVPDAGCDDNEYRNAECAPVRDEHNIIVDCER